MPCVVPLNLLFYYNYSNIIAFCPQVHTEHIQSEVQTGMLEYVCKEYKGPKPAACKSESQKRKHVCYKDWAPDMNLHFLKVYLY